MKLGIGSYTYTWAVGVPGWVPEHPISTYNLLDKAVEHGVSVVQIADNLPLHKLSSAEITALINRAISLDVQIEVGTRGISTDNLNRYLDIASHFRSPILRVVVDTDFHKPAPEEIINTIKRVIPELINRDVILAIENHDRFSCKTLVKILECINSTHVGICLDTVNSFGALQGPEVVIQQLGPWVVNLHIKDFSIARLSHQLGFKIVGKPAGQGRLNIPELLDSLKSYGRDFNAILELWTPPEFSVTATILKEQQWAHESITFLRRLIST